MTSWQPSINVRSTMLVYQTNPVGVFYSSKCSWLLSTWVKALYKWKTKNANHMKTRVTPYLAVATSWIIHFCFSFLPSAVFTWTNLLVVVVELDAEESEALDVVPLVTSSVLNEQQLIVGVVVVVDPGVVPINSRGEKQRMHLRDGFLGDQLDPIYVAYNM